VHTDVNYYMVIQILLCLLSVVFQLHFMFIERSLEPSGHISLISVQVVPTLQTRILRTCETFANRCTMRELIDENKKLFDICLCIHRCWCRSESCTLIARFTS